MIVLDTHALLWWIAAPAKLGAAAARAIRDADPIGIPSIVFWEAALLARKGRVELAGGASDWTRRVLSLPRVAPLLLTPEIAVAAESLRMHPDPADRFIVATALAHGAPIASKDRLIRDTGLVTLVW